MAAFRADAVKSPFTWTTRVYWEDTDAGGVVYHASYLCFLERARTEWLRAHGIGQQALQEGTDRVFAVRAMRLDFLKPARLDDQLVVSVELAEGRRASLVVRQAIDRGDERLLTAEVRVACLAASDFRPRPLPDGVRAALMLPE